MKQKTKTTKKHAQPASSSHLAGQLVGWLAPITENSFKLTYVMIWQQKHQQPLQNISQNEKKTPQIITCVMFHDIQERFLKTMNKQTKENTPFLQTGSGHQTKNNPLRTGLKHLKP